VGFEVHFVLLFAVATAVALLARWLRVPYTVALVIAGLTLGGASSFTAPHLTKELLYAVFLPGLLFEAAFHLRFAKFWENKVTILALAVPGVLAATALTTALLTPAANALHFVEGFSMAQGLVFGALISATDPIAVTALFRSLGVPKRLGVLVEGESLLNDGTAAVLFSLILAFVAHEGGTVGGATLSFVTVVGLGAFVGIAVSFAASKVIQQVDDPMIEITLTTIAAYGSFVLAEQFHASGVIATVAAGMVCGNYGARTGMSPSTRIAVESFWEYVAFALNSIVFLLIGLDVHVDALAASWEPILIAYLCVTLGRAVVIYAVAGLMRPTREAIPWSWTAILAWGGLRGGLSMVLVLGLAPGFPHRELLVTMTFGVVVLSILVQGLTMAPLLARLGIGMKGAERDAYEVRHAMLRASQAALRELRSMSEEGLVHPDVLGSFREDLEARVKEDEEAIRQLHMEKADLWAEEVRGVRRRLLLVQKQQLIDSLQRGLIGQHAFESVLKELDAELLRLETGSEGDTPRLASAQAEGPPPRPAGDKAQRE
jgi:CPA1 family monovalent cation:H+ antiporter